MTELKQIIENLLNGSANEHSYYGLRAHHNNETEIGEPVNHNSSDWQTETKLDGVCAIDVIGVCQQSEDAGCLNADEIYNEIMEDAKQYKYDNGPIILIGANSCEYGEDQNEIVISGIRIA